MTGLGAYLVEKLFVSKQHVYVFHRIGISMKVPDIIYVFNLLAVLSKQISHISWTNNML